jgi:DNA-binding transcriptional LysR family regulator
MLAGIPHNHWSFQHQNTPFKVKVSGNRIANDADLVRRWVIAGKGIALKSRLDMADALINKQVIELLPEYQTLSTLSMICGHRALVTPAITAFRDFLRDKCKLLLKRVETPSE